MRLRVNYDYFNDEGKRENAEILFEVDVEGIIDDAFVEMAKQGYTTTWEVNNYEIVFPSV